MSVSRKKLVGLWLIVMAVWVGYVVIGVQLGSWDLFRRLVGPLSGG